MPNYMHGKAVNSIGAVCGADQRDAITMITEDGHLVNCPDCIDLADIEAVPDDAHSGDPDIIARIRQARAGQWVKIDGVVIDMTTANAILTIYDKVNDANKAKIAAMDIVTMVEFTWKLIAKVSNGKGGAN